MGKEMKNKQGAQPKFKVGDVVEFDWEGMDFSKAIVLSKYREHGQTGYIIEWFEPPLWVAYYAGYNDYLPREWAASPEQIQLCKGMKNKRICNRCEHRVMCSSLQCITRCKDSENWKNEEHCEKCNHRFKCWTSRGR